MRRVSKLLDGGRFFEGPRWRDGRWWVSDFYRFGVFAVSPDGAEEQVVETSDRPSGLGWLPDGSLLVVSMGDRRLLRQADDGALVEHADLTPFCGGDANDMVVDASGRAWVGNFGFNLSAGAEPKSTVLVRVDPDGTAEVAADGLLFPNGCVITPDGRTLVVAETFGGKLTAFTITDNGRLEDRRVWADFTPARAQGGAPVFPDGCCLDADGNIWVADARGRGCLHVAEGGEILEQLPHPDGHNFYACMLGGDDGTTLLLCSAPSVPTSADGPAEAALYTCTVDVPHAGLP
jgi:sugar lactone lactonase YvrE